tara:strand:+ start:381 stop:776 length:396 start_codon:yes stop_codon:yes gene_type:complete
MKKYNLFLDDVRFPYCVFKLTILPIYENNSDWVIVRSYNEFVDTLKERGIPSRISFDHDLSYDHYLEINQINEIIYENLEEKTGYDAAKLLVDMCMERNEELPMYYVHSANPVGSENIKKYLENAKKHLTI